MNRKLNILFLLFVSILTLSLYGDLHHGQDPRGKTEKIIGEGDFIWNINPQKIAACQEEGKEMGQKFNIKEIRWKVTGENQDWVFTRITQICDDNNATIKRERFWVTIMKTDGEWVTRTKYRFNEGNNQENKNDDVKEKDKGSKFNAHCRITGQKIILAALKKKEGYIFKITLQDGKLQINFIDIHNLQDWTFDYIKQ